MRTLVGAFLGAVLASSVLWGCSSILGIKPPPEQGDSGTASPIEDGSMSSSGSGGDATVGQEGSTTTEAGDGGNGKGLGTACGDGTECTSGPCTDGVCCDGPCDGVCESCNLAGTPGHCTAIPANTDPDMECVMAPAADAGVVDA